VSPFLHDAGGILETAVSGENNSPCEIAILVGENGGLRIVDAEGWNIAALQQAYSASKAFTVRRTLSSVTVEARNGADQIALRRNLGKDALSAFGGIPAHLLYPAHRLLA
jgi:hypothetical protein